MMFTADGTTTGAAWLAIGATLGSALGLLALHILSPPLADSNRWSK